MNGGDELLPCAVESILQRICYEQNQTPPDRTARKRLYQLGEEKSIQILNIIAKSSIKKSLSSFIHHMATHPSPTNADYGVSSSYKITSFYCPVTTPTSNFKVELLSSYGMQDEWYLVDQHKSLGKEELNAIVDVSTKPKPKKKRGTTRALLFGTELADEPIPEPLNSVAEDEDSDGESYLNDGEEEIMDSPRSEDLDDLINRRSRVVVSDDEGGEAGNRPPNPIEVTKAGTEVGDVAPKSVPEVDVLDDEAFAKKLREDQKKRKTTLAAERKAKKANANTPSFGVLPTPAEADVPTKEDETEVALEKTVHQATVTPETVVPQGPLEGSGDHELGSSSMGSSGQRLGSNSIHVRHHQFTFKVDEIQNKFGVDGVLDNNPGAGLLALAALQQFPADVACMETDYNKLVAQGQTLIPQGLLALNAALAHQVAISKHYVKKYSEEKAKAEKLEAEFAEVRALAERIIDLEHRCVEAFRQKEAAEKLANLFKDKCEQLSGVEAKAKEFEDKVQNLEGQLTGVDEKIEMAVKKAKAEAKEESRKIAAAEYNEFYVQGCADSAQFCRRPSGDKVLDINNLILPQPDSKTPVLEPLSPREACEDEA